MNEKNASSLLLFSVFFCVVNNQMLFEIIYLFSATNIYRKRVVVIFVEISLAIVINVVGTLWWSFQVLAGDHLECIPHESSLLSMASLVRMQTLSQWNPALEHHSSYDPHHPQKHQQQESMSRFDYVSRS